MNTSKLEPYLAFDGVCQEAMNFYQSVLGGELTVSTFDDLAGPDNPVEDRLKGKIMHASLRNDSLSFMASDAMGEHAADVGSNVSLSIAGPDSEQLTSFFNGLSAGGKVTMPLSKQSWGDEFGMFTDKYGIHWMINISIASA